MHIIFDPDSIDWRNYFETQIGGGFFEGVPFMRGVNYLPYRATGNGIGALFSPLFRFLMPMVKTIGMELGKEGLATSGRVVDDVLRGRDVAESLRNEVKTGLSNVVDNLYNQRGGGKKRKTINKSRKSKNFPVNHYTSVGPPQLTKSIRQRKDYLGTY